MFLGDDENVSRSLRANVIERHATIVLKYDVRRHLPVDDLTENTIFSSHKGSDARAARLGNSNLAIRNPFYIAADRPKLLDDIFVTPVYMINAIDDSFAISTEAGENKRRGRSKIRRLNRSPTKPGLSRYLSTMPVI